MTLLLLLPSLILMIVVIGYPMIQGFWYSFTNGSLLKAGKFVGLRNYGKLLADPSFWHALRFSLYFAVANIVGCYSLGLGLALLLQKDFPGRGLFRVLLLLPWIVPSLVAIVSWRWMINDDKALFNQIIVFFGETPCTSCPAPIGRSQWSSSSRSGAHFHSCCYRFLPHFRRSTARFMKRQTSTVQRSGSFRHVTMPAISGISVVLCLLMTVWTVNDFDTPWLLAQGGPANATENLVVLAYRYTFARNDVGMGAAVSFVTLAILMVIFTVVLRLQREKR